MKLPPCPHGIERTRSSHDGLTAKCSLCLKQRNRNRDKDPERIAARKAYSLTPEGKAAGNRAKKKYIENNSLRRAAHIIVGNAVRDGKLIKQPCEVCGVLKVEAHHDDYEKPLDVRWLCSKHHAQHHKENDD